MKRAFTHAACASICIAGFTFAPAHADVVFAERANFSGRVAVESKTPSTSYFIWQEKPGGVGYFNTGGVITTDSSGDGSGSIINASLSALVIGRKVKIGSAAGPNAQPPMVVGDDTGTNLWPGNWFASAPIGPSGPHTALFRQTRTQSGSTLLETWEPGTLITLRLDPAEARWLDMGISVGTTGDLVASLVSATDQAVTLQIISDPTDSGDDLMIHGLGMDLYSSAGAGVDFEWTGSTEHYLDGVLEESFTWGTLQSYEFGRTSPKPDSGFAYCFGDGTGAQCPCSAFGATGEGCTNTAGTGATLVGSGSTLLSNDTFHLNVVGVPGSKPGLVLRGNNQVSIPVGDGILCTVGGSLRSHVQVTVAGTTTFSRFNGLLFGSVANAGGVPTTFQFWYRDPSNVCSGAGFNFTNAWSVTYLP